MLSLRLRKEQEKEYQLINNLLGEINRYMLQNLDRAEKEKMVLSLPLHEPLKTFSVQSLYLSSESNKCISNILEAVREKAIAITETNSSRLTKQSKFSFQVGDKVMIKVSPWKGVVRFGKRGKLNPSYVGPFKVLENIGKVTYKLELPEELSRVHNTFHVSNLKKCHADKPLVVPLDGLHFDDKLFLSRSQWKLWTVKLNG
nr:putative reverse transcriptase domain-containing protein [Tanacetum cinerariifolium]